MEFVTIVLKKETLQLLVDSNCVSPEDYEVKNTEIKDGFFDNDPVYKSYKSESTKAYKKLKEYEFNKRFNKTNT